MSENNLPKVEVKADLTETIEKAYDDTLKEPLKSSSSIVTTVVDFFHNTVMYPMQKYNLYAKDKLQNYATELQNRAQTIPSKHLISPRVNILGPTIDGLKYNLDEEYIKEMFTNILLSEMDNTKQSQVLPAYIEIVKQLSKDDAEFLENFNGKDIDTFAVDILQYHIPSSSGSFSLDKILILSENHTIKLNKVVIDNLERVNILKIYDDRSITDSQLYDIRF